MILYKEKLSAHRWTPIVPSKSKYIENERQWLLLENGTQRCAFLHVYIACQNSKSDDFLQWNEDLFHLLTLEATKLRHQGFIIFSLGDYNSRVGRVPGLENNTPDLNRNTPMFLNFTKQVNLIIINTLPISKGLFTRFMDSTGNPGTRSLIDYGLINENHMNTVTSFVIDEHARYDCGSDHALLIANLEFGDSPTMSWSYNEAIQFDFGESSDFTGYQEELDKVCSSIPLHLFENMTSDEMIPHITNSITKSGTKIFGLKIKKRKRALILPRKIIDKIKNKNLLARNLCLALRQQAAGNITGAYNKAGNMVFKQDEIEDAIIDHFETIFIGKRIPVFTSPETLPNQISLSIQDLENILSIGITEIPEDKFEDQVCALFTFTELEQVLSKLPSGKASGYDQIPNEFLKHSSFRLKLYILLLLNKIIKDGRVPEALNLGKCMLIHKV